MNVGKGMVKREWKEGGGKGVDGGRGGGRLNGKEGWK